MNWANLIVIVVVMLLGLTLLGLSTFFLIGIMSPGAFLKQKEKIRLTHPYMAYRLVANIVRSKARRLWQLAVITLLIVALPVAAMDSWDKYGDTAINVGILGLYGLLKFGKWVLIFGIGYFIVKTIVEGVIEIVSDRVAEKMRNRE